MEAIKPLVLLSAICLTSFQTVLVHSILCHIRILQIGDVKTKYDIDFVVCRAIHSDPTVLLFHCQVAHGQPAEPQPLLLQHCHPASTLASARTSPQVSGMLGGVFFWVCVSVS